jgi:hypothetical protein
VTTAKLPAECLARKRRLISDLAIGEAGNAWLTALIITPDHDCFLDARGTLEKPLLLQMTVRRDEEGFHVVLPSAPEFTAQPLFKGWTCCRLLRSLCRETAGPGMGERLAK